MSKIRKSDCISTFLSTKDQFVESPINLYAKVEHTIEKFNKAIDAQLSFYLKVKPAVFFVPADVSSLNFNERDQLEAVLIEYGNWCIISGDRSSTNFSPAQLYTKETRFELRLKHMILNGRYCPFCEEFTEKFIDKWRCPCCSRYVGCYSNSDAAYGLVADSTLRSFRIKLHIETDTLWQNKILKRSEVYDNIANLLNIDRVYSHIGMLDLPQCRIVEKWALALNKVY